MKPRLTLLFVIIFHILCGAETSPCDIIGGRSELILDVTESIGQAFDQPVEPQELPIEGDPGNDIDLELSEKGQEKFSLQAKSLSLIKPLDRDETNLSTLRFEISCIVRSSTQIRSIPVVLRIRDLNDNPPEFKGAPYLVAVKEDAIVNSPIFNGIRAEDRDSGRNGQVEYEVLEVSPNNGGNEPIFSIRFPHQGAVFLMAPLDYETTPLYHVTILATDYSENERDRLNTTTTLTVRVQDVDDQDPVFGTAALPPNCPSPDTSCMPEYQSSVIEGEIAGVLDVYPGRIHAKDLDTLGASIVYSFRSGTPTSFEEYFKIDSRTAAITQIKAVDRTQIKSFNIVIQAVENTSRRGRAAVRLLINVQKVDTSPPKLVIPAYTGKVLEASEPGTSVLRDDGSEAPFVLAVFDPDLELGEEPPKYVYELTTSAFEVNDDGILVVASPDLDRDPPSLSEHTFQVIAREDREGGSASAPVTLTVRLLDINDNPPRLPILPTVTVPAGSLRRSVIEVKATDADEGQNAVVRYELLSGGRDKFSIDAQTGMITAIGNLEAGEKFFLNTKATDMGNLSTEGFVEIVVSRGPNTNGPIFSRAQYSAIISEDIPHGEEILSVEAKDPEDDVSYYAIAGGNEGKAFEIDTLSGLVTVVAPLDREKQNEYSLATTVQQRSRLYAGNESRSYPHHDAGVLLSSEGVTPDEEAASESIAFSQKAHSLKQSCFGNVNWVITAEDSEGKSNTANVVIKVTDVNDETPSFVGEPYSFRVDEGIRNASVGLVKAEDNDLGIFGKVSYHLEGEASQFKINSKTGEISTNSSLDYEKDQVHYVSVVAHDMADDPRSATTTVTILVNDLSDENPFFPQVKYKVQVLENTAIGSVITTVVAKDKDTVPIITYKMMEGDPRLFKVAPDTGRVTVAGNLDYEVKSSHSLVIGTEENVEQDRVDRTTVVIEIEDMNDETPVIEPIHTVTLAKEAPLSTLLTNVSASDADGTSPNNKIKFTFGEGDDVKSYFDIDETKGEVRLKRLLTDAAFKELMIKIIATDGGEPPLSTSEEFRVLLLERVVDSFGDSSKGGVGALSGGKGQLSSLASSPRFSKNHFELQVNENLPLGSVIVRVPLMNTTVSSITCSIVNGNEQETFMTKVTRDGNCKIISSKNLDFEEMSSYNLSLALHPEGFAVSDHQEIPVLSEAFVQISVRDINDNSPTFVLKGFDILKNYPNKTVLSFALQNSAVDTKIIELKALDFDSGKRGLIEYKLLPESNRGNYFSVDAKTGRIYTKRKLYNVPLELQPFNLSLIARDKPGMNGTQHSTTINVIIPVIEESHRSVLILNSPKEEVSVELDHLRMLISETTGKTAQIEEVKQARRNSMRESHLWFHLLEPDSWQPVNPQNLYEEKENEEFLQNVSGSLESISALQLVSPVQLMEKPKENGKESIKVLETENNKGITRVNTAMSLTTLEYALIALAGVIIFFVLCAIILICLLWSRFSKKWNSADKTVMLIPPVIDRPASVLESVSKEYEVQVLHMSVPLDDDSVQEIAIESESPRHAYLDNVSYISKSRNGLEGSSSGGSSGMATPSALGMDHNGETFSSWSPDTPIRGDHFSNTHLDADPNALSASATNENVMFGRRGFGEPSPVETTTEL